MLGQEDDGPIVPPETSPLTPGDVFRSFADVLSTIRGGVTAAPGADMPAGAQPGSGSDGIPGLVMLGRILDELVAFLERLSMANIPGVGPAGRADGGGSRALPPPPPASPATDVVADVVPISGDRNLHPSSGAGRRENRRRAGLEPAFIDAELAWADRAVAELLRLEAAMELEAAQLERERHRYDALTGVLDRRAGIEALSTEIDRCRRHDHPLVVAFVDVDGLKRVNDTYGHEAGDVFLIEVAGALTSCLRSYDVVFRLGGDEFVCCIDDADVAATEARFHAVNETLAQIRPGASVSVGLAVLRPTDTPQTIIARADAAMYERRRRGG